MYYIERVCVCECSCEQVVCAAGRVASTTIPDPIDNDLAHTVGAPPIVSITTRVCHTVDAYELVVPLRIQGRNTIDPQFPSHVGILETSTV